MKKTKFRQSLHHLISCSGPLILRILMTFAWIAGMGISLNSAQVTAGDPQDSNSITQRDKKNDWIGQIVQLADKRCDWPAGGSNPSMFPSHFEPKDLSDPEKVSFLINGLKSEKTLERQMVCLKILVERFPLSTYKKIEQICKNGSLKLEIRQRAIWVAGLMRRHDSVIWLEKMLNDMEPQIREAAIDAIGFVVFPKYCDKFIHSGFVSPNGASIDGIIPIYVSGPIRMNAAKIESLMHLPEMAAANRLNRVGLSQKNVMQNVGNDELKQRIAKKLVRTMTHGRTQGERIAAARALAGFTPKEYQLRVAEWGVWIESGGKLQLAKTVLDEIPPIAYQTKKQIVNLKKRVNQIMIVTKPVIHLRVDRPMSIDVNAYLRQGQPWFFYPQPNDFAIMLQDSPVGKELSDNDFLDVKKLSDATDTKWLPYDQQAHSGYPFLLPKSPTIGTYSGRFGTVNRIDTIGIRWQHLIVSPKRLDWMVEKQVDQKYAWWSQLRDVQSAWISNGFESEKFLYYDGPTLLKSPLQVIKPLNSGDPHQVYYAGKSASASQTNDGQKDLLKPIGIFVEVKKGKVKGLKLDFALAESVPNVDKKGHILFKSVLSTTPECDLDLKGVQKAFLEMIRQHNGLEKDEAEGLVRSWENQFFQTDGKRLIIRMNRAHYDYQCPIEISPKPTQMSRVGLVLSELD